MKIRVDRSDLTDAVSWTARSLPARPTILVLSGLLLSVEESGALRLAGSDLEVSSSVELEVSAGEAGRVLVPGRLLADITRSLPNAPVDLVAEGNRLVVSCGATKFTLPTLPVEDYPDLPAAPPVAGHVSSAAFSDAVAQVAIAAGRDDTLPVLTGVRMEINGESLILAATDRYRLAVRDLQWRPASPDTVTTALVPARTLADAAKSLAGAGAEVTVLLGQGAGGENLIGFAAGHRQTTTRLIDGEYPKYGSLFPAAHEATAEVDTAALVEAVKRVSLVAQRSTPVRLAFGEDNVVLEAGSGDDAQASERVDATLVGEPLTIAFNPQYLLDGLGALGNDTARFAFTAATRPAVLTGAAGDTDRSDYRYLIMPVRLSG